MIRLALVEGQIGNPVAPQKAGLHGHPVAFRVRGAESVALEPHAGRFLLPEDGVAVGDVLVFARSHGSGAYEVKSADEHLVELEPISSASAMGPNVVQVSPGVSVVTGATPPREPGVNGSAALAMAHMGALKQGATPEGKSAGKEG